MKMMTYDMRWTVLLALALLLPGYCFGAINTITFPATVFQPDEGPQPPLPTAPLAASQAILTFNLDATAGSYRATVKSATNANRIVATREFTRTAGAGDVRPVEVTVPLDEGTNRFVVTVQDQDVGSASRTSQPSPQIIRDLKTTVQKIVLDAIQPPTRSTNATEAVLEFTLNGTASEYQIDVIRNAAAATTFTTNRVGVGRVTVPLLLNTANDFLLRATANDTLAIGAQRSSNIISITQDGTAPTLANVSIFPGPTTDNAVINVIGETEPFSRVSVDNVNGQVAVVESDLSGSFIVIGLRLPLVPPGPTTTNFTVIATDQAGNRSTPTVIPITRTAADPRFEFLELTPPSGSVVKPGTPIHVRGSVGERSGPFDVRFFIRSTTGSFQVEERLTNLAAGAAFEKDFHLTANTANPDGNIIYSVEAIVSSTAGASARQLVGEVTFDAQDPPPPEFESRLDPIVVTNSPKITAGGAAEELSTIVFNAFPGVGISPSTRIPVESTPIIQGGEFRSVIDLSALIDGFYSVRATTVATSGRFGSLSSSRELRFQRDTTSPSVQSVTINGRQSSGTRKEFFGGSQFVTLRVRYSEPMGAAPEVFVTQRGNFALPAALTATVLPGLIFEYTYVTLPNREFNGPAEVVITGGQDLAGNPLDPEVRLPNLFFVDTRPPVVDPSNTRPAPGSVVSSAPAPIFITILEDPNSAEPASGVDIEATTVRAFGPLETDPVLERTGFTNIFSPQSVTFQFDPGQFVTQGTYQLRVTLRDNAGNTDTVNLIYKLDRDPISPVFLASSDPPDGAVINGGNIPTDSRGRTVLSAVLSSITTPELDLEGSRFTLEQACPAVRSISTTIETSPPDRLDLVLGTPLATDGSSDGQYIMRIFPRDTAGNETSGILRSFVVDTARPSVQDGNLIELGGFGNTAEDSFAPARGQLVTGPLTAIRSVIVDGVASSGYPGSGVNTSLTTGATVIMTLIENHRSTSPALPVGSSTTNSALLQSNLVFRDVMPPVASPCFTGPKRATVLLELRIDPATGRPMGLTTGGDFDGRYQIRVTPADKAGNSGNVGLSEFIFDSVPPPVLTVQGLDSTDVFTGRKLTLEGTTADNDKTPRDHGQGIARVEVTLYRADASFVTTGAPLLETTTTTLAPNVELVQAETEIHWLLDRVIPSYNGNAVLQIAAVDRAGNRTLLTRQFVIQNLPLEKPVLSSPPLGSSTSGPIIDFRWTQVPGASGYLMTLTNPEGNRITRTTDRATPTVRLNLDALIEGRYSWTVQGLDSAGKGGDPALNFTFRLDVTAPAVNEIFSYDATVPDAQGGTILNGQIRIGLRFSEEMDRDNPPEVFLRPANTNLDRVAVSQISYDESVWRGLVDIQPDAAGADFNGTALIEASGARDLAGNLMPVTSSAFEVDIGPYWDVRAFANPIARNEIIFHVKALTQSGGVPEQVESHPLLLVTQPGRQPISVKTNRRTDSVFSGVYVVNQAFSGEARLAITGADTRGNTSTRLIDFSISAIVAANRNKISLPSKAGQLDLPPDSLESDGTVLAFGGDVASSLSDDDPRVMEEAAASRAGLVRIASIASFLPADVPLGEPGEIAVQFSRFAGSRHHPPDSLGLYALEKDRYRFLSGRREGDRLTGQLDRLARVVLMADRQAPTVSRVDASLPGQPIEMEEAGAALQFAVDDQGSGLQTRSFAATIDGEAADTEFDPENGELSVQSRRRLTEGEHAVEVEARDRAGNKTLERFAAHAPGHAAILEAIAYPNPARFSSAIRYRLSAAGASARVRIHDVSGDRVYSVSGPATRGVNRVDWPLIDRDGSPVASGIYFARIKVDTPGGPSPRATIKIAVLR